MTEVSVLGTRLRISTQRLLVVLAVTALLIAGVVVAVASPGYPSAALRLSTGQVWLASSSIGQIALVDGTTGEVVDRVAVAPAGHALTIAQPAGDAVVADSVTGAVSRFDTATLQPQPKDTRPLPGTGTQVFDGSHAVQAISATGQYVSLDASTLAPKHAVTSLGRPLDAATTVVDGTGRLWALDASGALVGASQTPPFLRAAAAAPGGPRLAVIGDSVAVVDPLQHKVTEVRSDGSAGASACLPTAVTGSVAAGVSPDRRTTLVASDTAGALVVVNLTSGDCSRTITLSNASTRFGTPVTSSGRAFVPDLATGEVYVVDLATNRVIASPTVITGGSATMQLLARDGVVFYNDPRSDKAGVVRLNGSVIPIDKYAPVKQKTTPTTTPSTSSSPSLSITATTLPPSTAGSSSASAATETLTLSASSNPAVAGRPVHLTLGTASGAAVLSASWSFGDGSPQGSGVTLTHTWASAGPYQVFIRATTAHGSVSSTVTLRVVSILTSAPVSPSPVTTTPSPRPTTTHPVTHPPHTPTHPTTPTKVPTTTTTSSSPPAPATSTSPSPSSATPSSATPGIPDAPVVDDVTATAPDQTLHVTFTLDGVLHGTTFSSIQYKLSDGTTGTWTTGAGGGAAGTYTLTTSGGLSTAAPLNVTLLLCTTVNGNGGPCSSLSNADKGAQPYGTPRALTDPMPCSDHLGVGAPAPTVFQWTAPPTNGRPITGYAYTVDSGASRTTAATNVAFRWSADANFHRVVVHAVDDRGDAGPDLTVTCQAQWPDPVATGTVGPVVDCPASGGFPAGTKCEYLSVHLQWFVPGSYTIDYAHNGSWELTLSLGVGSNDAFQSNIYWHTDGLANGCGPPCPETIQFRMHDVRGIALVTSNVVDWAH